MRAMSALFLLIWPVIKCYMNLLESFNSFISSLRALGLSGFAVIYCSWEDVYGCLMYYLPCLYSQTEGAYIPHIHTFLYRQKLSCFNLCCVAPSCLTPFCASTSLICLSRRYWNLLLSPAKDSFSSRLSLGPSASFHRAIPHVILIVSDPFPEVYQWLPCVWATQKCAEYFQYGLTSAEYMGIIPLLTQLTVLLAKDIVGHLCCQGALLAHTHTLSSKRPTHHF